MKSSPESTSPDPNDAAAITSHGAASPTNTKGNVGMFRRFALFLFLAAAGCLADLWTKSTVFNWLHDPGMGYQQPYWLVEGVFGFQTSLNAGALFGIGHGKSWLFASISVVFLAGILVWLIRGGWRDLWMVVTVGMIAGGIMGNLYDRIGWGAGATWPPAARNCVRDWLLFRLEGVPFFDPWPNFNIADALLVAGAVLVLIYAFRNPDGFAGDMENSKPAANP